MPRIRMTRLAAGPGILREPGKVYEVSAVDGDALVAVDAAVWVDPPPPAEVIVTADAIHRPESAMVEPTERAVAPPQRRTRGR